MGRPEAEELSDLPDASPRRIAAVRTAPKGGADSAWLGGRQAAEVHTPSGRIPHKGKAAPPSEAPLLRSFTRRPRDPAKRPLPQMRE